MATTTLDYHNVTYQPRRLNPIIISIILLTIITAIVIAYGEHALKRHGADAVAVRECMENKEPLQHWISLTKPTEYFVCQLDNGQFGIMITYEGKEQTSFIYRASKGLKVKLSSVENYLSKYAVRLP